MNESRRLVYLQAMGIDSYVSRRDLPAAAPSRRLRIVQRQSPPVDVAAVAAAGVARPSAGILDQVSGVSSKPSVNTAGGVPAPAPEPASPPAKPQTAASEMPIFSVIATQAGGWLWLDEVPAGRDPGPAYEQLLQAICHALGLPESPIDVSRFSFPHVESGQLGRDIGAAREALLGYLNRRLDLGNSPGVVLLGAMEHPWFDRSCLEGRTCVTTVSAWQMLRDPGLKSQAWTDLKALRSDGG